MEFKVKKEIIFGPKYIEHLYPAAREDWIGVWKKTGHQVLNNSYDDLCFSCKDHCRRKVALGEDPYLSQLIPETNTQERSYQVRGFTKQDDKWEWEFR